MAYGAGIHAAVSGDPAPTLGGNLDLDDKNLSTGTSTGSQIGTAAAQKLGFFGATPVVQPAHIDNPSGGATVDTECRVALSSLLAQQAQLGLQASS